jgi:ABC-type phosphate transport system substrate-binding protein
MHSLTRRGAIGLGAGAAAAVGLSGCGTLTGSDGVTHASASSASPSKKPVTARPIGDGSTSFTG